LHRAINNNKGYKGYDDALCAAFKTDANYLAFDPVWRLFN